MSGRSSPESLERSAVDALRSAAQELGFEAMQSARGAVTDLELRGPGATSLAVDLMAAAIPTDAIVRKTVVPPSPGTVRVLVADQISAAARAALNAAGIGWLDRRGHLRLVGPGVYIDADVPPLPRTGVSSSAREPINGRSGLAAAAALLLRPDDPLRVSEIARVAGLNPSSISRAMGALARAHLAERRRNGRYRALIPELFWALADAWPRDRVTVRLPSSRSNDHRLRVGRDLAEPGWALAGVRGAVAWGAPLAATGDYPLEIYVPDEETLRRAAALSDANADFEAALSVDPVGLITRARYAVVLLNWPVAHPLFCALDLTASSRDREALEQWTPPQEFTRVW